VAVAWTAGAWPIVAHRARPQAAYPAIVSRLESWAKPTDVVLVHSIPSGVVGMARYLHRDLPLISWVVRLGHRTPDDLRHLLAGHGRVALVQIHSLVGRSSAEPWLDKHARRVGREVYIGMWDSLTADLEGLPPDHVEWLRADQLIEVHYFEPKTGDVFFPGGDVSAGLRR
jgi:hypothetical protein